MLAKKIAAPHAARNFLKALRGLMATAIPVGLRTTTRLLGFRTWTEEEIAQFEAAHPVGSRARLAFGLLLYAAHRRGDVVPMGRQDIQDGFIRVRRQKTGAITEIPVLPELQEILSAHPVDNKTLLMTSGGKPFTAAGFTGWFRDRCRETGLPLGLSAQGLRKAACRQFAEANCTVDQIAAFSGHASLKEVQRYTKAADQKRLAVAAMEARAKNKGRTKTGKPKGKVSQNEG